MKVSVLIVNWNGASLLKPCLAALGAQTHPPHQIIVVDNGSTDGSRALLEGLNEPRLETCYLPQNSGFSGGNNAGFPLVTGDVLALLNNDTVVDPDWIAAALPAFSDPEVGMVACKTLRLEDPGVIDKVGHLVYPDGLNRGRGTGQPDDGRFDTMGPALWPDGGAGFYRKSMLDEIGLFDDDFFLYGEDAELGMRARWAGYTCVYVPGSRLLHHHSGTLGRFSPLKIYYIERNRLWVLIKTFPLLMVLLSPWPTFMRYLMNLVSLLSRRGSAAGFQASHSSSALVGALLKALLHGVMGAPKMWRKRGRVLRRISSREMRALLKHYRISTAEITLQD